MEEISLYRCIPLLREETNSVCCFCKKKLTQTKKQNILVYNFDDLTYRPSEALLLYCNTCNICFADRNIFSEIRKANNGFCASGIMMTNTPSMNNICKEIEELPPIPNHKVWEEILLAKSSLTKKQHSSVFMYDTAVGSQKEHPHPGFTAHSIFPVEKNISVNIINELPPYCPICSKPLKKDTITIPVSWRTGVDFYVKSCGTHFFSVPSSKMQALLQDNYFARNISVSFLYFFKNYFYIKDSLLSDRKHWIVLLCKESKRKREKIFVISDYNCEKENNISILDYKDIATRKLLTEIFKHRKQTFSYNDETYNVIYKKYPGNRNAADIIPQAITLKDGGGKRFGLRSKNLEIVDLLMYSPKTDCFETVPTTYDKINDYYYIAASGYMAFIQKNGNPNVTLFPDNENFRGYMQFGEMNSQSLLNSFGYTVNGTDNLSSTERHKKLDFVIDNEILQPLWIIAFLQFLISINEKKQGLFNACYKWQSDIEYIEQNKLKPTRIVLSND